MSECTVFLFDTSKSMIQNTGILNATQWLEYALLEKNKKLRKTDYVGCYFGNTALTSNSQNIPNVFNAQPITAPVTVEHTKKIIKTINHYIETYCDGPLKKEDEEPIVSMVQSLLVASLDLKAEFKSRKILKQIMVFTDDLDGLDFDEEEIETFSKEIDGRIYLVNCGNEYKDNPFASKWGALIKNIPSSKIYQIEELLKTISNPIINTVKPVRIFQGMLRLGADLSTIAFPDEEDAVDSLDDYLSLSIHVEGFFATKPVSSAFRKQVMKAANSNTDDKTNMPEYVPFKSAIEYEVHDKVEDKDKVGPNGEKEYKYVPRNVNINNIAKAYRYGSRYEVLPSILLDSMYIATYPGIDIRGFVNKSQLPRYYLASESTFILADTKVGTQSDNQALTALADAMIEKDKLAIVRYVPKKGAHCQMCILCPILIDHSKVTEEEGEKNIRAFVLTRLPFAEDERLSDFPRLSNRGFKNEEEKAKTEKIDALMEDFVDQLDMDDLAEIPENKYYAPYAPSIKNTTLPLPCEDTEIEDPLRIPAIHIHRQKEVLMEWVDQIIINNSKSFNVSNYPATLMTNITPYTSDKFSSEHISELVELLAISKSKHTGSANGTSEEQLEWNEDSGPSYEELVGR